MLENVRRKPLRTGLAVLFYLAVVIFAAGTALELLAQSPGGKPDLKVTIDDFEPTGWTDRKTNITIVFSTDLVPEDSLDRPVFDPPVVFDPPIRGIARWVETNTLRFFPETPLLPATDYTARVKSNKSFVNGNRLKGRTGFSFKTARLKLDNSHWELQPFPEQRGQVQIRYVLYFNYEVDLQMLQEKLKFKGVKNAAKSRLHYTILNQPTPESRHSDELDDIVLTGNMFTGTVELLTEPVELTGEHQRYILKIDKGLTCYDCGRPLDDEIELTCNLRPMRRFRINNMDTRIENNRGMIRIFLSTSVTADEIRDLITISPEVDFTLDPRHHVINIRGDFKPQETYEVTVSPGVPGVDGSVLEREFSQKLTIPDFPAAVTFTSPGLYLPRRGHRLLEVRSVNIDTLAVEIQRIFANNLVYALAGGAVSGGHRYGYGGGFDLVGRKFKEISTPLVAKKNTPLLTSVDIGGFIPDTAAGLYKITARNKVGRWTGDTRLLLMTDIGIMARRADDYLMVWANHLDDVSPVIKGTVRLYSRNNQVLLEGQTDSRGIVVFENFKDRIEGFAPFLITVEADGDMAYLKFSDCLLPTHEFDIKGRPYMSSGYDAYIYTDRGVYRPGDTAHIAALIRGVNGALPDDFPYLLIIKDPTGREFASFRHTTGLTGFNITDLSVPAFARTGKYQVIARIGDDYIIGQTDFLVEEFMPDRIKVAVASDRPEYVSGDSMYIDVRGKYLFGPPASGHRVSGHLTIEPHPFSPRGWTDYSFSDYEKEFSRMEINLEDQTLDDSGYYLYTYKIHDVLRPPSALKALLAASVFEEGGRAVSAFGEAIIHPYDRYVGMRVNLDGWAKPGQPFTTSLIVLDTDGSAVAADSIRVNFFRTVYQTTLRKDDRGYYRYISERTYEIIDSALVAVPAEGIELTFTPPSNGSYRLEASDPLGRHSTIRTFYASGWYYAPWSMESPDRIEIELEKKSYSAGDNAVLQIKAPFGGKLLLTVEKEKVLDFIVYDMAENSASITLPVKRDYFPNAYITATVIKKAGDVDPTTPARAFGIASLMISKAEQNIGLTITAPDVIRPDTTVKIIIRADRPGRTRLTVAAVDIGILNLTDFKTPDPLGYFYGKKKLHLSPYDIYSFIYPEIEPAPSHLAPAGGRMFDETRKRHLNPIKSRRVKPVALWSGLITTDDSGYAECELKLPQFNGAVRIMVVATREQRFGSAEKEMIIRDKIVLMESFPRFISPRDKFDGLVTVFNNTGKPADIEVALKADGSLEFISDRTQTIHLDNNTEKNVVFKLQAGQVPGLIGVTIEARAGGDRSHLSFEMPNRPALPLRTEYGSMAVNAAREAGFTLPENWVEGTAQFVIQTSSLAENAFVRNFEYLLRYPYGCLEQTTSRAFPLLYYNSIVRLTDPELFGSRGGDYYIREAILKISDQLHNEYFTYWPGGNYYHHWSSIYAAHFLYETVDAGYYVEPKLMKSARAGLRNLARGKVKNTSIPERVYAAYVLAKSGELEKKILNYLRDLNPDELTAFSRFQLAGALARSGDREAALAIIPDEIQPHVIEPETGGTFNSGARTNAILLDVLLYIDPDNPACAVLAKSLMEDARVGRWYNTQGTAYALMALGKYLEHVGNLEFTGTIKIDGLPDYRIDHTREFRLTRRDLAGKEVTVEIDGGGTCFIYWQAEGIPLTRAAEEYDRGITVSRDYFDTDGDPLQLHQVAIGDQVVARITAYSGQGFLTNVIINDLLPAGFEIENPRLKSTPKLGWIPKSIGHIDYQDIRDDRLLLFVNLRMGKPSYYYYSLRAIATGEFKIPPIMAECMYNPLIAGSGSSGFLNISSHGTE